MTAAIATGTIGNPFCVWASAAASVLSEDDTLSPASLPGASADVSEAAFEEDYSAEDPSTGSQLPSARKVKTGCSRNSSTVMPNPE